MNELIRLYPIHPDWGTERDVDTHLVLVHPEIPQNAGNIARLCAATGVVLHLVEPLGFILQDRYLKRAGLDYWPNVVLCVHADWSQVKAIFPPARMHFLTTKTERRYTEADTAPGGVYICGRESQGLEPEILAEHPERHFRIPITDHVRSLNLSNACSILLYDVRRRQGWPGMA
jgi:tRNA (cytidine/uridine-2'-O-)-methyltransferase